MKEDARSIISSIKMLSIDMMDYAKKGYPGITLSAAPILYTLYANHMRINPDVPNWPNRDRFVLSASHGASLLYSTLFFAGYPITLDDLVTFGQIDSKAPVLPSKITPGIDLTTHLSGQGFVSAVGMAMGEKYLQGILDEHVNHQKLLNHMIYCLVSDGDLQEGMTLEAISLAAQYKLGNLIVLYDRNEVTADGLLSRSSLIDPLKYFEACGWHVEEIQDVEDLNKLDRTIKRAKSITGKPSIISIKSLIGKDSYNQGTNIVHDHNLSKDDIENLRKKLHVQTGLFEVSKPNVDAFRKKIHTRVDKTYKEWNAYLEEMKKVNDPEVQEVVSFVESGKTTIPFDASTFHIQSNYEEEITESNSKLLNIISRKSLFFMGGSCDLSASTKTYLNSGGEFGVERYRGKNISFGLREHAMGFILNGISSYGIRTFGSTYLRCADYHMDALRDLAKEHVPVTFIYTHDGVTDPGVGDGYHAYEMLEALRNIPNLDVYRPGDINEVIGAWNSILTRGNTSCLVVSDEVTHILAGTNALRVNEGAYLVRRLEGADTVVMATGHELLTAMRLSLLLEKENIFLDVISCPNEAILRSNPAIQKDLFEGKKLIVLEQGVPYLWTQYTSLDHIIGVSKESKSGRKEQVLTYIDFNETQLIAKIKHLMGRDS